MSISTSSIGCRRESTLRCTSDIQRFGRSSWASAPSTQSRTPAEFFGILDDLGTVEEGKLADLLLLAADPLENISNTQRVNAVVADGRLYERADLDAVLAKVEANARAADEVAPVGVQRAG